MLQNNDILRYFPIYVCCSVVTGTSIYQLNNNNKWHNNHAEKKHPDFSLFQLLCPITKGSVIVPINSYNNQ